MQTSPDNSPVQHSGRCLVIVPAFNEAGSVGQVVVALQRDLPEADVLVVDDGSTDGTHKAVPEGVGVLRLPFNLGIGGAMQAGYKYAFIHGYDLAMQVDGVYGAQLVGAGLGGCVVIVSARSAVRRLTSHLSEAYYAPRGLEPSLWHVRCVHGGGVILPKA